MIRAFSQIVKCPSTLGPREASLAQQALLCRASQGSAAVLQQWPLLPLGDYRRKFPHATAAELRQRQDHDAAEAQRTDWGKAVQVYAFRFEVQADDTVRFVEL